MKFDDINIEAIEEIYLLANTPAYLYRQLQKHDVVHWLAKNVKTSELLKMCGQVAAIKDRSLADVARAYAALVALLNKVPAPTDELLRTLANLDLDWASNIVAMFRAKPVSARRIEIDASVPRISSATSDCGTSSAPATVQLSAACRTKRTTK